MLRVMRGLLYVFTALTCGFALAMPPPSIEGALGANMTYGWASLGLVCAVGCLTGVVLNRYRVELGFVWFTVAAVSMYVVTVWALVGSGTTPTGASGLTVAVLGLAYRGFELQAHASKLRRQHYGGI